MMYVLDANVFIEAKNRHYGLDFCPAFWDWLLTQNTAGKVCSLDKVYNELLKGADELSDWAKANESFFQSLHSAAVSQAGKISGWVMARTPAYTQAAKDEFLGSNADYWLVAHAVAAGNITIVTHEVASPDGLKRIKIPDACAPFSVLCISPFEMLRAESAQFVLP